MDWNIGIINKISIHNMIDSILTRKINSIISTIIVATSFNGNKIGWVHEKFFGEYSPLPIHFLRPVRLTQRSSANQEPGASPPDPPLSLSLP